MTAFIKKAVSFLVYSNLFIAACALALAAESFVLLQLPRSINWYLLLLFCCTVFVYCLHYFTKINKAQTDARLEWCRKNKAVLIFLLICSAVLIAGGVIFHFRAIFLKDGAPHYSNIAWFIIVPLLALGYTHPLTPWNKKGLRQTGWLKLLLLSFTWSFTTTVLPVWMLVSDTTTIPAGPLAVLFIHRLFFMAALCMLFNIADHDEDKRDGVQTVAVLLGPEKALRVGKWFFLITGIITGCWLLWSFGLTHPAVYFAVFIPPQLVWRAFHRFDPLTPEAFFVLRYDGLMIIKAVLLIFALLTFHYK